ncbi:MAG: hypothetical protein K5846_08715 [Bacteroidales bacterium]|nr:hypothetical protein [Bacteroidales bacterium]
MNRKNGTTIEIGEFGPIYRQFKGKPKEAIRFLRKVKNGECVRALFRPGFGYIDIVWGEVTDSVKHKGFGLSHIIDKHEKDINNLGYRIEDFIPLIIQFGHISKKRSDEKKVVFESSTFRFVVQVSWNGQSKVFLLTAFSLIKKVRES